MECPPIHQQKKEASLCKYGALHPLPTTRHPPSRPPETHAQPDPWQTPMEPALNLKFFQDLKALLDMGIADKVLAESIVDKISEQHSLDDVTEWIEPPSEHWRHLLWLTYRTEGSSH